MSSDDFAVRVRDVSKHFLMYARPEDRLKQSIVPHLQRLAHRVPARYFTDFQALRGVSFDVGRGETVGIVGRNGSGKSTLLQIVCGTLSVSAGTVEVRGRIAALLELGAGFNPEFTGRENVYLNAAILGLDRHEIDRRFDDIASFADIGAFLEHPVKTYSSGMYVRLAFATAINVAPDILVVDEALSVGDEAFQRKCYARIEEIKGNGGTILFVSHGAQTIVRLCDRAILLDGGEVLLDGRPKTVVHQYQRLLNLSREEAPPVREEIRRMDGRERYRVALPEEVGDGAMAEGARSVVLSTTKGTTTLERFDPAFKSTSRVDYERNGADICDLRVLNLAGAQVNVLERGQQYVFEYFVTFLEDVRDIRFGMLLKSVDGIALAGFGTEMAQAGEVRARAGQRARVRMQFDCKLGVGAYFLNCGVGGLRQNERVMLHRILDGLAFRVVESEQAFSGYLDLGITPSLQIFDPSS